MEKMIMTEIELGKRWGLSPKTLQRWRSEGNGPNYWKLSKRVVYPIEEVLDFEKNALHRSTSEKMAPPDLQPPSKLCTSQEAAMITGMPLYWFTHPRIRHALDIPSIQVGKSVRFNPAELRLWFEHYASLNASKLPITNVRMQPVEQTQHVQQKEVVDSEPTTSSTSSAFTRRRV